MSSGTGGGITVGWITYDCGKRGREEEGWHLRGGGGVALDLYQRGPGTRQHVDLRSTDRPVHGSFRATGISRGHRTRLLLDKTTSCWRCGPLYNRLERFNTPQPHYTPILDSSFVFFFKKKQRSEFCIYLLRNRANQPSLTEGLGYMLSLIALIPLSPVSHGR